MTAHRVWLKLHQWAGLTGAAFIFVMGATGSALVFENGIDRALNPSTAYVAPAGRPLALSTLVARANAADPADPVGGIHISDQADQAYELSARRRHSIFINQYSGEILGMRNREQSFARFVHLLHTRFVAGEIGEHLAGAFTVVMLFLAASGIVLWWPRKIVWPKAAVSWKRTNFDLHNTVGFYSSIIMFVIALAGVLIAFEGVLDPLVLRLNAAPEADLSKLQSMPEPGARRIPPEDAIAVATGILPGAFASNINVPAGPKAIYRILLKFPEDRTPAGRSRVYVDQFSGTVVAVESTRTAQLGRRVLNLKRSLHTGDIFGAPTEALYFLVSLGVALQVGSGVLIWWNSR
ncbi:MAG TPA: PepSY-associated TM helix domain-containing protein [Vicinamibacterales bacterium]